MPNSDRGKPWYRIEAKAAGPDAPTRAKVLIYDAIGGWFGVDTPRFVAKLVALDVDEIELHLNSPGGDAWDGIAIMNALRQHRATVQVVVDGMAASAASVIAMAGDEIVMARGSQMMVHDARGICVGWARDMTKTAELLDKLSNNYAGIYAARAGGTRDEWRAIMLEETWYDADEAVAAGLADRTDEDSEADAQAMAAFDLSAFTYRGRADAPGPKLAAAVGGVLPQTRAAMALAEPPTAEPAGNENTNQKEGAIMASEAFMAGIRERLGITDAELGEDGMLAALDEALTEQATETATLPQGVVAIEQGVLDGLRADAAAGKVARDQQVAQYRESLVDAAIEDGRIPSARRDHWVAALAADEEGASATLASLEKGLIPVDEIGYTASDDVSGEDALYATIYGPKEV